MGNVKIFSVLLLCMFASREWTSCEASRKMFMGGGETDGAGGLFSVSRKILAEVGEETNDMETELILPDETDGEKLEVTAEEIESEQKNVKQQKEPLMDAVEEEGIEKKKKKQKEDVSNFEDGELLLEEGEEGKWTEENTMNKKKESDIGGKGEAEALAEQESEGQLTGGKEQKEGKGGIKAKKKAKEDMAETLFPSQTSDEDRSFIMETEGEVAEGFAGEASLADIVETEVGTGVGSFLSEVGEEDRGNAFKEKLLINQKKSKKEEVEGSVKANREERANVDEVFKSKAPDGKAFKQLAKAEEIRDEDTPADVIEQEMQGGAVDLIAKAVDEEKGGDIVEVKRKTKGDAGTKQHGRLDESTQSEGGNTKKSSLKKTKTSKQSKSEAPASEEKDTELKEFKSSEGEGGVERKTKKKKDKLSSSNSRSELEGDSNVFAGEMLGTKVDESSDLQSKQGDTQDMAKLKTKKKKKAKSSEKSKDGKSSGKKDEKLSEKAKKKETQSVHKETEVGTEDVRQTEVKKGEETPMLEILEVVNVSAKAEDEDDTRKERQSEAVDVNAKAEDEDDTKKQKQSEAKTQPEDELPTIEKQEEKLEVEVQGIAKDARERAEGSVSLTKSVLSSTQGVDEEEDEYGDFMQDFSDVSTNFQDTALKVADHIGPNIQKFTDTSKNYFNKANQQITESFSPLVGKQFAPFFASVISYGLLLVPLAVVILMFEHIRALLSLQKVLLFVNIYLAAYFATLLLATFIIGEPMNFFYKSSASGYIHLQLLQALGYIIYLILHTFDLVSACSSSETLPVKVTVVLQWFVAFTIGFHYYVTIFHRAMALKGPHTSWKIYGIYSIAFSVLCLFARIKRVKKGYVQLGQADADTDKKH